jgi:S1-C subfamily serine protease
MARTLAFDIIERLGRAMRIKEVYMTVLDTISDGLAQAVAQAAPSVVQVVGRARPASGLAYGENAVVTTARALGREGGLRVRRADGVMLDAELAGWDPATDVALLRVPELRAPAPMLSDAPARVGHLVLAIGRSWSNGVTASVGIVSIVGGPLRTGRHGAIEEVIRTTAPMHDGFAGGALVDTSGRLIGMATASAIRGLGVVIPARIVWNTAAAVLERGRPQRGYLGLAGQSVQLPEAQRHASDPADTNEALLVVAITPGGPAAAAGVLVGDIVVAFDQQPVRGPEDLLDLLTGDRVGRSVVLRVRRGGATIDLEPVVASRESAD